MTGSDYRRRKGAMRRVLVALTGATVLVLASSAVAFAHVTVAPDSIPRDAFTTLTFTVPNEEESEDTVGIDVSLPPGFLLESAEGVAGWQTEVETGADGVPTAIHWSGGRLGPHTFGEFAMRGRVTRRPGTLSFAVVQRYQTSSVSWSGPAGSERPAATVTVAEAGAEAEAEAEQAATPQVPVAPNPTPAVESAGESKDDLARSRASLALMLALAALLVPLSIIGMTVLRRRASSD